MRQQANERLSSQKDHALEGLGGVTQAVRTTTQSLREQQHDTIARYVEQAADQVDRLADTLRNKDVAELIADAQRLARRQPAVFVGSAFAVGLLAARFLKSSSPGSEDTGGYDYREYRSPSTAAMSASRTT
jgi:hypothetical protein